MNDSVALTRARFALETGEPERAEPILRRIVASDPANIDAYYILGLVLAKLGKIGALYFAPQASFDCDG